MSSPVSLCDHGKSHFQSGRWTEGPSCFESAFDHVTNDQDKAEIHVQKGYCLMQALHYQQAKAEANKGKVLIDECFCLGKKIYTTRVA